MIFMLYGTPEYKEWEKNCQFVLKSRDMFLLEEYGFDKLPLKTINKAFKLATEEVLFKYDVEVLSDIPFGKGFEEKRVRFVELLKTKLSAQNKDSIPDTVESRRERILNAFKQGSKIMTTDEVVLATGMDKKTVTANLRALAQKGLVSVYYKTVEGVPLCVWKIIE